MALALSLVGQPVQPYLTTGATDFVNSVQKGKEDAIKTDTLKTTSQKSALDLLTAQKKAVKEEEVNSTMPELMGRIAKGELTDKQKSDFLQAHPEMAQKYIATNDEKAKEKVNNAVASTLLNIAHSADKVKAASDGVEALKHFGINLNLRGDETPEQIQDALTVSVNGMKALEATGSSVDAASGRVVKTNKLGQVTDIGAAPTNKAKAVPELDASGKEITRPTKLGNKTIYERKMSDGTWVKLAEDAPPAPKTPLNQFGPVYFDSVMGAYVQKNLSTGAIEVKDKGYEQGDAADGLNPRKQAGSQEKQRAQALLIPAGQSIKDIKNITMLSPDIKFSMAQDVVGKGGTLTSGIRNFLSRSSTDAENRKYETAVKGLNNAIARLSNAGYTFTQAQANAYEEALRFTDKDTNETKVYALLTGIQHIREALKSTDLGTKEQRNKAKEYIKELDQYPEPEEFINSLHKQGATVGGLIPKTNASVAQPTKPPQSKQPIQVKNTDDYNRLKAGDVYIDPKGVKRTKS